MQVLTGFRMVPDWFYWFLTDCGSVEPDLSETLLQTHWFCWFLSTEVEQ